MSDNFDPSPTPNQDPAEKAKRVERVIRSLGAIIWDLAWLWGRIENPAIERRRRRGIDKKRGGRVDNSSKVK